MKSKNVMFYGIILIINLSCIVFAQDNSDREKIIFQNNLRLYEQGDYEHARQNFELVVTKLPQSPLITSNYLMLIKSLYKLKNYTDAIEDCKTFLEKFPKSTYTDDVLYVLGNAYYQLDRYRTAARSWINSF